MAEACFSMRVVKAEITKNRRRQLAEIFVNAILNLTARAKIALLAKRTPFVAYLRPQRVNAPRVFYGVPEKARHRGQRPPFTENRRRQLAEIFVNMFLKFFARAKIALLAKRTPFVAYLRPQRVNVPRVFKGVPF